MYIYAILLEKINKVNDSKSKKGRKQLVKIKEAKIKSKIETYLNFKIQISFQNK